MLKHRVQNSEIVYRKVESFKKWLTARGAEILEPTSQWELLRFRAGDYGTGVIYQSKTRRVTLVGSAELAWHAFTTGSTWEIFPKVRIKSDKAAIVRRTLLERDGHNCFYCGLPLQEDITEEHLLSRTAGGPNHIANKVLAHAACNRKAGHLSIAEKVRLRENLHTSTE